MASIYKDPLDFADIEGPPLYKKCYVSSMKNCASLIVLLCALIGCARDLPEYDDFAQGISKTELMSSFGPPERTAYFYALSTGEYIWSQEIREMANIDYSNEVWFYPAKRTSIVTENREYVRDGIVRVVFQMDGSTSTSIIGKAWIDREDVAAWFNEIDT